MIYKIFAYGSLINTASLKKTVPGARNMIPAKIFGLQRVFNLASQHRHDERHKQPVCVLNVEPIDSHYILNGACFEMPEESLKNLLHREKGYEFCTIEACHYHDEDQVFQAYIFRAKNFHPYRYLANSSVQKHYLQLCLNGCQVFGSEFVTDFKKSTSFWGIDCERQQAAIWQGKY
jgi:cation transport regulator ChaC